jgi:hypothetical protein
MLSEAGAHDPAGASALKAIRACVPFTPPPEEMTVAIAVAFGPKL